MRKPNSCSGYTIEAEVPNPEAYGHSGRLRRGVGRRAAQECFRETFHGLLHSRSRQLVAKEELLLVSLGETFMWLLAGRRHH